MYAECMTDIMDSWSFAPSAARYADDVVNGDWWRCEFDRAKGGSITWLTAEEVVHEVPSKYARAGQPLHRMVQGVER